LWFGVALAFAAWAVKPSGKTVMIASLRSFSRFSERRKAG
jgi:hypothetical protein